MFVFQGSVSAQQKHPLSDEGFRLEQEGKLEEALKIYQKVAVEMLVSEDVKKRQIAANSLSSICQYELTSTLDSLMPVLIKSLDDKDEVVHSWILGLLKLLSGSDFGNDSSAWQSWLDELSMKKKNVPKNIPKDVFREIQLLFVANPVIRAKAALKLGSMKKKAIQAVPYLIQGLNQKNIALWIRERDQKVSWVDAPYGEPGFTVLGDNIQSTYKGEKFVEKKWVLYSLTL